jgi:hypothetical protein
MALPEVLFVRVLDTCFGGWGNLLFNSMMYMHVCITYTLCYPSSSPLTIRDICHAPLL